MPIIDDCLKRTAGQKVHPQLVPSAVILRLRHFEKVNDADEDPAGAFTARKRVHGHGGEGGREHGKEGRQRVGLHLSSVLLLENDPGTLGWSTGA